MTTTLRSNCYLSAPLTSSQALHEILTALHAHFSGDIWNIWAKRQKGWPLALMGGGSLLRILISTFNKGCVNARITGETVHILLLAQREPQLAHAWHSRKERLAKAAGRISSV